MLGTCLTCLSTHNLVVMEEVEWKVFDFILNPISKKYPQLRNNPLAKLCTACQYRMQYVERFRLSAVKNFVLLMSVWNMQQHTFSNNQLDPSGVCLDASASKQTNEAMTLTDKQKVSNSTSTVVVSTVLSHNVKNEKEEIQSEKEEGTIEILSRVPIGIIKTDDDPLCTETRGEAEITDDQQGPTLEPIRISGDPPDNGILIKIEACDPLDAEARVEEERKDVHQGTRPICTKRGPVDVGILKIEADDPLNVEETRVEEERTDAQQERRPICVRGDPVDDGILKIEVDDLIDVEETRVEEKRTNKQLERKPICNSGRLADYGILQIEPDDSLDIEETRVGEKRTNKQLERRLICNSVRPADHGILQIVPLDIEVTRVEEKRMNKILESRLICNSGRPKDYGILPIETYVSLDIEATGVEENRAPDGKQNEGSIMDEVISTLRDNQKPGEEQCTNMILRAMLAQPSEAQPRRYRCNHCTKTYASVALRARHEEVAHKNLPPVKCTICQKQFRHKYLVYSHMKCVHSKGVFCDICNRYYKHSAFKAHLTTSPLHNKEEDLNALKVSCTICNNTYQNQASLNLHMKKHTDAKFCERCDKWFHPNTYRTHLKTSLKHVTKEDFKYTCDDCGEKYYCKVRLQTHIMVTHLKIKPYKCVQCQTAYKSRNARNRHVRVVHEKIAEPKNHICEVCGSAWQTASLLQRHLVVHTGERPYECDKCDATFGHKSALYLHNRYKHEKKKCPPKKKKTGTKNTRNKKSTNSKSR